MLHLIMAFHPEDVKAGPSGVPVDEILALLGLDTSNSEKEEVLGDSDEDDLCIDALDRFERQRVFQTQLLQQSGGGAWMMLRAPLTLTPPTWSIVRVVVWAFANVISRPSYVKEGTLLVNRTLSVPCKTG